MPLHTYLNNKLLHLTKKTTTVLGLCQHNTYLVVVLLPGSLGDGLMSLHTYLNNKLLHLTKKTTTVLGLRQHNRYLVVVLLPGSSGDGLGLSQRASEVDPLLISLQLQHFQL